jgi:hypothetical protein
MNITLSAGPLAALVAGILILILPAPAELLRRRVPHHRRTAGTLRRECLSLGVSRLLFASRMNRPTTRAHAVNQTRSVMRWSAPCVT